MSAPGPLAVEPLLALAQALARDHVEVTALQRDLACVHDEIQRVHAVSAGSGAAEVTSTLARALRDSGLSVLADRARDGRELLDDLERLQALVATIAATRGART